MDRRGSERFAVVDGRAWLGWWKNGHDFSITAARLVNISRGGALLFLDEPPPAGQAVWFCLGTPTPTDCLQATVLEVLATRSESRGLRLQFRGECPERVLWKAFQGLVPALRNGHALYV